MPRPTTPTDSPSAISARLTPSWAVQASGIHVPSSASRPAGRWTTPYGWPVLAPPLAVTVK